jgi:hypothetical protein
MGSTSSNCKLIAHTTRSTGFAPPTMHYEVGTTHRFKERNNLNTQRCFVGVGHIPMPLEQIVGQLPSVAKGASQDTLL